MTPAGSLHIQDANGNDSDATSNQAYNINNIPMTVEENYGSVSITLPIEEDITWRQGLCYCWRKCRKKDSSTCTGKAKTASTEDLNSSKEQDTLALRTPKTFAGGNA